MNTLYRFHIGLLTRSGSIIGSVCRSDARAAIDAAYPDGYTLTETQGRYKGTTEPSWIVEVYGDYTAKNQEYATRLAIDLRELLCQESIGLALLPVSEWTLI